MLGSNVFDDAEQTSHLRAPPKLQSSKTRKGLLQGLLASIPVDERAAARSEAVLLDEAIKDIDGQKSIVASQADREGWALKGMTSHLKHYQVMGLAFMRRRERSADKPRGGILADGMGLGKTIMTFANIINGLYALKKFNSVNKGKPGFEPKPRPTLIIVPAGLMIQWQEEMKKHCHYNPGVNKSTLDPEQRAGLSMVMEYKGMQGLGRAALVKTMSKHDVVFATYYQIRKSCPKMDPPPGLTTAKAKADWYRELFAEAAGPLHQVKWQRVVLDEAHTIKNHLSRTSLACRYLKADHYWAVSGTPVQNSLQEFYPYLRLIREPCVKSMRHFNANFSGDPETDEGKIATRRLGALLGKVMIRRTHADTMLGAKLLDIPKAHMPITLMIEFNSTERRIYEIVRRKFIHEINEMAKSGKTKANYKHIYTLVLRLRQATGHILLLRETLLEVMDRADFEELAREAPDGQEEDGVQSLLQLRFMLENIQVQRPHNGRHVEVSQSSHNLHDLMDMMPDIDDKMGRAHGTRGLGYSKYIKNISEGQHFAKIVEHTTCADCGGRPVDAYITSCQHVYCHDCLLGIQQRAARNGLDGAKCTACKEQFISTRKCHEAKEDFVPEEEYDQVEAHIDNAVTGRSSAFKYLPRNEWLKMAGAIAPSSKTMAMKMQVLKWIEEDPDVKIIIFSQFIHLLDIIKLVCIGEHWTYKRYQGDMTLKARNQAISDFFDPTQDIRILLASLKSGGQGLNLTAASRVLIMDSWWNDSAEQQAFCRVHRHGQEKETHLTRLVVKNTIDQDMMKLKERKLIEIDPVMDKKQDDKKLTVDDLMGLFGQVSKDDEGNPFVFVEDADDHDDMQHFIDDDSDDELRVMMNDP